MQARQKIQQTHKKTRTAQQAYKQAKATSPASTQTTAARKEARPSLDLK
jgi:hypothetical protein